MRTILTFGDSNTHGTPPIVARGTYQRFGTDVRWPQVMLTALGAGWSLVEEGLPGRTAQFPDLMMGTHMDGRDGLKIALNSHGPLDVLTIMLGTNDSKARFCATPEAITGGIAGLLDYAQGLDMQARHPSMRILVVAPPAILEQGPIKDEFYGAAAKAAALPPLYAALAAARGCAFLDAGAVIGPSPVDGIHFEPGAHVALGAAVAAAVAGLG